MAGELGRGRGGIEAALAQFTGPAPVAAAGSDGLCPLSHSQELVDALPGCEGVDLLHSDVGHDGFLVESAALNALVRGPLAWVDAGGSMSGLRERHPHRRVYLPHGRPAPHGGTGRKVLLPPFRSILHAACLHATSAESANSYGNIALFAPRSVVLAWLLNGQFVRRVSLAWLLGAGLRRRLS